ncbi:hypothetical protein [Botrimarina colliarenosi]|uniref:hypothetical protein n=1 Tax=Botrimarina colliarenosi TaxID=2528001 RepID=UPI0018D2F4C8|nr:hypothetical protein [Botrimarina colliarenosi]
MALEQVLEVRRLLDEGQLSRRAIAAATGVSRGSVGAIAKGERGLFGAPPVEPEVFRSAAAQRCPGCGGMVFLPCVLCEAVAHRQAVEGARAA